MMKQMIDQRNDLLAKSTSTLSSLNVTKRTSTLSLEIEDTFNYFPEPPSEKNSRFSSGTLSNGLSLSQGTNKHQMSHKSVNNLNKNMMNVVIDNSIILEPNSEMMTEEDLCFECLISDSFCDVEATELFFFPNEDKKETEN